MCKGPEVSGEQDESQAGGVGAQSEGWVILDETRGVHRPDHTVP